MTTPEQLAAVRGAAAAPGAVAYRMLGSRAEADDAVQEAWLRLSRADADGVDNLGGWLTTVVARVCLDMLRSRTPGARSRCAGAGPAHRRPDAAGSRGRGGAGRLGRRWRCWSCWTRSTPAERLAFVLHDLFAVPFDEIAPIVGRSPDAARQLASRARRRVRGAATPRPSAGRRRRQRAVVTAFLAASRGGDFDALLALLDPDVVLRADPAAVATGADAEVRGARGGGRRRSPAGPGRRRPARRRRARGGLVGRRTAAGGLRAHGRDRPDHRHRAAGRRRGAR